MASKSTLILTSILVGICSPLHAKEASGGLSLITEGSARASGLSEAFTAVSNDIAGLAYNPAALGTLETGQASLLYRQGLIEDSYGHFNIGTPKGRNAYGLSVGYYNGGDVDLVNETSGNMSSVAAQRDLTVSLSVARKLGRVSWGLAGKYLNSELIEEVSATAYAVDLGMNVSLSPRFSLGAAVLNYGTELKYESTGNPLPQMLRLGASYLLFPGRANTTLFLDAPYMVNEEAFIPSAGLETLVGPLAIRAGFKGGDGVEEFSMGAGFAMGRSSLDYSFGLINQLDTQHKVSLGMKFGGTAAGGELVRIPLAPRTPTAVSVTKNAAAVKATADTNEKRYKLNGTQTVIAMPQQKRVRRVYVVKSGDTLASIAQRELGDRRNWKRLYFVNKHLIDNPTQIKKGMSLVLPE